MKNTKWIATLALTLGFSNIWADECSIRLKNCQPCDSQDSWDWIGDILGFDRSAANIPGVADCVPCMAFCRMPEESLPRSSNGLSGSTEKNSRIFIPGERRLILGQDNNVTLSVANINPDAAFTLHALGEASKNVNHSLPSKSAIRGKQMRSTEDVAQIVMGFRKNSTDPSGLSNIEEINHMSYELIEYDDGDAFLLLSPRIVDQQGRVIKQAWPDVQVRLQWTPSGEAGYWQPVSMEKL